MFSSGKLELSPHWESLGLVLSKHLGMTLDLLTMLPVFSAMPPTPAGMGLDLSQGALNIPRWPAGGWLYSETPPKFLIYW